MATGDNPLITSLDMGDTSPEMMQQLHQGLRNSGPLFDQLWEGVKGLASLPSRVYRGEVDPMSDEAIQWGTNLGMAGLGAGGATAAIAGRAPLNQTNMLIGPGARNGVWNAQAAAEAARMEAAGVPRTQIWNDTGTFRGVDQGWRQEIPDPNQVAQGQGTYMEAIQRIRNKGRMSDEDYLAAVNKMRQQPQGTFAPMGEVHSPAYDLDRAAATGNPDAMGSFTASMGAFQRNPLLYKAYPELRNMPVTYDALKPGGGSYNQGAITLGGAEAQDLVYGPTLLAHEAGHAVQQLENWAPGTNPDWAFMKPYNELMKQKNAVAQELATNPTPETLQRYQDLTKKLNVAAANRQTIGRNLYNRSSGEAEANALQARYYMTPAERAAKPFWRSYPITEPNQIILER